MKKIFTFALSAMFMLGGGNLFAQEEDVTHYIVNAGFDEDLTFQKDGTMKEAISTTTSLSDRSWAYIAEDSTVYARPKETSGQSRPDGRKLEAVNGFKGRVKGWTLESNAEFPKCEWTYFGTVPYDIVPQSVPIADDGSTYLEVPERPTEFDGGEGFVYLRAGWTNSAVYKQVVKLPCAVYRLEYWTININPNTSSVAQDLTQIVCRKDVFKDEESTGLQSQVWTKHEFEFTPTAEFTMQFGYEAANAGSGGQPIVALDGIKLYKIGEADVEDLLRSDINDEAETLEGLLGDDLIANYEGLARNISDVLLDIDGNGEEELTAKLQEIKAFKEKVEALKPIIENYQALVETAEQIMDTDNPYPGFDDFEDAFGKIADEIAEAPVDEFAGYVEDMQKAINDYYMSQEATPENPADYTAIFVSSPYFTKVAANPFITYNEDGTIASVSYPNEADYTAGSAPEDGNSEGWYVAGTTGGDQRLNYTQGRVCWNAWRTNAEDVAVAQDLVNLPNGYYTVSAELITQPDYVSNQHLYATSTLQDAVSPALTSGNWDDGSENPWTYLTTEKVLVHDGKLTIGASGSALDGSTNQTGWFCVTNFRLMYYGPATDAEIAAAIDAKFAAAEEKANALHFAADKAAVLEAIAAAKAIADLDSLNAAIAIADASEAEYNGVIAGSYNDLQEAIENDYSANAKALAQVPVQYMTDYLGSAAATYKETPAITTILRYYRDNLIPALQNAEEKRDEIGAENGKAVIDGTIASVIAKLTKYTDDTDFLAEQVAALNAAIAVAEAADITIEAGADVTAFIKNPTIDDTYATGWTINKIVGDGNGAKTGQQIDGGNGYYIDTWNSTGGTRATWYQVLDVPNGTYTIKNIMRTSGTGAYLFASDKAPVTVDEVESLDPTANNVLSEVKTIPTNMTKYYLSSLSAEEGGDSINYANDSFGQLWMAAADAYMERLGVTGATEDVTLYDIIGDLTAGVALDGLEAEWDILSANNGTGRGWVNNAVQIEVKDHTLVLGVTCDYAFVNKTEEDAFTGSWFSADNFTLTIDTVGDNTGWDPTTGIAAVEGAGAAQAQTIYSISGARLSGLQKGINIVKMADGRVQKVLVK